MAENENTTGTPAVESTSDLLRKMKAIASDLWREPPEDVSAEPKAQPEKPARVVVRQPKLNMDNLWMTADETIDWTDALAHEWPSDGLTNIALWKFYHKNAEAVLGGDLNAYAEVLRKANPLGELMEYAEEINMRAPDPDRVEATFGVRDEYMEKDGKKYLSAMGVRIARDLLACLPVSEVKVTAAGDDGNAMEAVYTREQLMHRNFRFLDPIRLTEECGANFGDK